MATDFSFLAQGTRSPLWDLLEGIQVGQQIAARSNAARNQAKQLRLEEQRVGISEKQYELAKRRQEMEDQERDDPLKFLSGDNLRQYLAYTDKGKEVLGAKGQKKLQEEFDAKLAALRDRSEEDKTLRNVPLEARKAADALLGSHGIDFGDDKINQTIGNVIATQGEALRAAAKDAKRAVPSEAEAQAMVLQELLSKKVIQDKSMSWLPFRSSHSVDMNALSAVLGITEATPEEKDQKDKLRMW